MKALILADSIAAYAYNIKIYTGAGGPRSVNIGCNTVIELTEDLRSPDHHLYFDSYYCSVPTVEYLSTKQIGSIMKKKI